MRKICVVTGSRAEYGIMSRMIRLINDSDQIQLQLIATNMHLSPKYGETYKEIEADGIHIDKKIPILDEEHDDAKATLGAMAKALNGFADAYNELNPDLIVVLGDRFEILAAVIAAMIEGRPIAHIGGGNLTEGAYDDAIRHSITKMSHLHFCSTDENRQRIIQLGEQPDHVFNFGSPGIENILKMPLMSQEELGQSIPFEVDRKTLLVTYHPMTLSSGSVLDDIRAFLKALDVRKDFKIIFTMPNSDTGGNQIIEEITRFVEANSQRACAFKSLGLKRYLSVMHFAGAVVGNSSSGIVEAPSFNIPTLDIGDRQKGRMAADSVYHCATDTGSILKGLEYIFSEEFQHIVKTCQNPYDKPNTAESIFNVLSTFPLDNIIKKHFYQLPQ